MKRSKIIFAVAVFSTLALLLFFKHNKANDNLNAPVAEDSFSEVDEDISDTEEAALEKGESQEQASGNRGIASVKTKKEIFSRPKIASSSKIDAFLKIGTENAFGETDKYKQYMKLATYTYDLYFEDDRGAMLNVIQNGFVQHGAEAARPLLNILADKKELKNYSFIQNLVGELGFELTRENSAENITALGEINRYLDDELSLPAEIERGYTDSIHHPNEFTESSDRRKLFAARNLAAIGTEESLQKLNTLYNQSDALRPQIAMMINQLRFEFGEIDLNGNKTNNKIILKSDVDKNRYHELRYFGQYRIQKDVEPFIRLSRTEMRYNFLNYFKGDVTKL